MALRTEAHGHWAHARGQTIDSRRPSSFATWIGAAQITLRSIEREKLKSRAPDILIRPAIAEFGILDFFKAEAIFEAAEPAKEQLKRELERVLSAKVGAVL